MCAELATFLSLNTANMCIITMWGFFCTCSHVFVIFLLLKTFNTKFDPANKFYYDAIVSSHKKNEKRTGQMHKY